MLSNCAFVAAIGVLLFPLVMPFSTQVGYSYFAARIIESILLAAGVLFLLLSASSQVTAAGIPSLSLAGNNLAYQAAMIALGLGSISFWYVTYRYRLLPAWLGLAGAIGYPIFAAGALLELFGLKVGLYAAIPGGLFEVGLAIWLIVRGFSAMPEQRVADLQAQPLA
jgi:hypothetical protein